MYKDDIMSYFPLDTARAGQTAVLKEIDKVIKQGKKFIILEGPVGCGKSAIAMTLARAFGSAHVITPLKSLQNQYYDDFSDDIALMKGRGSYPCVYKDEVKRRRVIPIIEAGAYQMRPDEIGCDKGPCTRGATLKDAKGDAIAKEIYVECTGMHKDIFGQQVEDDPCPYTVAVKTAQKSGVIVHNFHSFLFQTQFSNKFQLRDLLVIDEAHMIEGIVREFLIRKISVDRLTEREINEMRKNETWVQFLLSEKNLPMISEQDIRKKRANPEYLTPLDLYKMAVDKIDQIIKSGRYAVRTSEYSAGSGHVKTSLEFVPASLGTACRDMLFNYGDHVLLMSGTIFDKDVYCKNLGIDPATAHFIRISSEFPVANRPIYLKDEYQVDTSFANWQENFPEMIEKIKKIMGIFSDAKGLIHAPSYQAAEEIMLALGDSRVIVHGKTDFQEKLKDFYESDKPLVFISPVCQQGVDFKDDRARFQIVTRIPYLNTSDEFVKHKVENDFAWYNYQALIIFGQQLGRVNRNPGDYGATFLMDSRFNKFVKRNLNKIPKWVQNAFIWR